MTREEAIEVYNGLINTKIKEAFEFFAPELRENESEDERIRKELVQFLTEIKNISEGGRDSWHVRKEDAKMCTDFLAYLEKQKEQKHPNGCFTCDEYKKGYEEGRRNGFTAGYNKAMKEVEQKEQKPWKVGANAYFTPEQKPVEWSEEDEKIITRLIDYFESFRITGVATKWEGLGVQEVITLLKSLRPSWKPSEEQMKALLNAEKYLNAGLKYGSERRIAELYEQLKKL